MHKKYDLAVKTGSYTDREGKEKGRYENIGSVMVKDDGGEFLLLKRTFNLAGVPNPENRDTILVSKFAVKEAEEKTTASAYAKAKASGYQPQAELDDEIPFAILLPFALGVISFITMGGIA